MFTRENTRFLQRCFDIARLAHSSPNPLVGAVIVSPDERIIGEGYTQPYGGAHAEVMAVASVKNSDRSLLPLSTIYVSLEPCAHWGRTPPCVELILKERLAKVVIAHLDPNPLVAGKSITKLQENGIEVQLYYANNALIRQTTDLPRFAEEACSEQRQLENGKAATLMPFLINRAKERPFIILKWAETADGFIGKSDERLAISNKFSNRLVHKWRSEVDAIMVGTNTAALDNPELTNRLYFGRSPMRIVLDKNQRLPPSLKLFDGSVRTLVFSENTEGVLPQLQNDTYNYNTNNVEKRFVMYNDFLLENVLTILQKEKIGTLFVEGGAKLLSHFINRGLWDEARIITSSQTLGAGIRAPQLLAASLQQTVQLDDNIVRFFRRE
jgi:diaminohydroxyphosphoribosylaminopyrimidine deaminase / 5-amino-6-(5-phosphoribosylamino)uracil reductase